MKILHTADWHIGKLVNQVYMTGEQQHILEQFVQIVQRQRPDVVIVAGDLYDRSVPPVEAVELVDKIFTKIVMELHVPLLAVAGNHDSPDRLGFASELLRGSGLYIEGPLLPIPRKVVLEDDYGPVNFYLVPYAPPAVVREVLGDQDIHSHDDAMASLLARLPLDHGQRNVLVTHGFVRGAEDPELSDSEKPLSIGGTDCVSMQHFQPFHYTALGHLHGPQKVGSDRVRYAGSLLKYSFSEVKQHKTVTMVQLDSQGQVDIKLEPLVPQHDMRKIRGPLQALLDPEVYRDTAVQDYLHVTLTDEGDMMDAMSKLRAVYPNVLELERERRERSNDSKTAAHRGFRQKSTLELFREFYQNINGSDLDRDQQRTIVEVITAVEADRRGE